MNSNFIRVGKIVNTIGLKGELKIYLYTDFAKERFKIGNQLFIGNVNNPSQIKVEIQSSKPYKNMYVLKFKDYNDINDVENLKNNFLWINKEQQKELTDGEYYYHQIIGCKVISTENEMIGEVKEIFSPGANDVWVVMSNNRKEILVPYIDSVVKEVDVINKKITIELIDGLMD